LRQIDGFVSRKRLKSLAPVIAEALLLRDVVREQ
jgi:hypothetical protein